MTTSNEKTDYRLSFDVLKTSARSDKDVAEWFIAHRECIPGMPGVFKPYMEYTFPTSVDHIDGDENSKNVVRHISLHFRSTLPLDVSTDMNDNGFLHLTGHPIETLRTIPDPARYDCELNLSVSAMEWPYVVCEVAYRVLNGSTIKDKLLESHLQAAWQKHCPQLPWASLSQMHGAGLLNMEKEDFVAWAMASPKTHSNILLPAGLAI